MNKYRTAIITSSFIFIALVICLILTRPFADEEYDQSNVIKYYLFTPRPLMDAPRVAPKWYFTNQTVEGSNLQITTLHFTGIQPSDVQRLSENLQAYIDHYPNRNETMSVAIEEKNGLYELRINHYNSDDER
ncbi:hypothetical protein UXO11_20675 [Enterobacter wuhouensis]|uniref:hypothetical protein n=1 Tax=Enterobacter wuhouensis TaxID=2529381 RepID=UPI002FCF2976